MIIKSYAPTRISLFGGGTDIHTYYEKHEGIVLNFAINLRQRMKLIFGTDFSGQRFVFPPKANITFYSSFFKSFNIFPISAFFNFDGDIQTGIGTSASCAVALVACLSKVKGECLTKEEIAEKAWDIEVNHLGMFGGKQDQYAASFGGLNIFTFTKEKVLREEIKKEIAEELKSYILLFDTGIRRARPDIQGHFVSITPKKIESLNEIKATTNNAIRILMEKDYEKLGFQLKESWMFKKNSNPNITNSAIDNIYETGVKAGAWGGKLCGSGGGGYMIFMADPQNHHKIIDKLQLIGVKRIDYSIDNNGVETRIL